MTDLTAPCAGGAVPTTCAVPASAGVGTVRAADGSGARSTGASVPQAAVTMRNRRSTAADILIRRAEETASERGDRDGISWLSYQSL